MGSTSHPLCHHDFCRIGKSEQTRPGSGWAFLIPQYRLADAFDVLPVLTPHVIHQLAMVFGDTAAGTVSNLLSNATAFGLQLSQAQEIIGDVQKMVQTHWQDSLYEAGLGDEEIWRLEPFFQEIPAHQIER